MVKKGEGRERALGGGVYPTAGTSAASRVVSLGHGKLSSLKALAWGQAVTGQGLQGTVAIHRCL